MKISKIFKDEQYDKYLKHEALEIQTRKSKIKIEISHKEDVSDEDITKELLEVIYQIMIEKHDKNEVYERMDAMENLITNYLNSIKW